MATETTDVALLLVYNGVDIRVKQHRINSTDIYRVFFSDCRPPLLMTIANKISGKTYWTSLPEGRQGEAEEIAVLVDKHYLLL